MRNIKQCVTMCFFFLLIAFDRSAFGPPLSNKDRLQFGWRIVRIGVNALDDLKITSRCLTILSDLSTNIRDGNQEDFQKVIRVKD